MRNVSSSSNSTCLTLSHVYLDETTRLGTFRLQSRLPEPVKWAWVATILNGDFSVLCRNTEPVQLYVVSNCTGGPQLAAPREINQDRFTVFITCTEDRKVCKVQSRQRVCQTDDDDALLDAQVLNASNNAKPLPKCISKRLKSRDANFGSKELKQALGMEMMCETTDDDNDNDGDVDDDGDNDEDVPESLIEP
nr:hypothetical protein HmN_000263800 [Hymenolepis microstoma]